MRRLALVGLLFATTACRREPIGGDLDRLESALALSPVQKPAWESFRREAEAAEGPGAPWRRELREAMSGERFDAARAHAAADAARRDAGRLIEAWRTLDAALSPAQRAAVKAESVRF